jgi:hypothetical protein
MLSIEVDLIEDGIVKGMERSWEPRASELILAPRISPFVPIAYRDPLLCRGL